MMSRPGAHACFGASAALLALAILSAACVATTAPPDTSSRAMASAEDAFSAAALMDTVQTLASPAFEGREAGTDGGRRARAWLRERLVAIGLTPAGDEGFEQSFPATRRGAPDGAAAVMAANLLGRCQGRDPARPNIVVSAHYDHLGTRNGRLFPGADDNASGVAVWLAIAATCVKEPFQHTVVFAAFDAEEGGLQGARAFLTAPHVERARIALNVNLDMVARGDRGELFAAGLHHTPTLTPLLAAVADRARIRLRFGHDQPGTGTDDWTMQSDHGVFHEAGIPFVYFGVEDHPDYHQPTDTADKIDPMFFEQAARVILDAVRTLDRGMSQRPPGQ